jgi:hypothetical protein
MCRHIAMHDLLHGYRTEELVPHERSAATGFMHYCISVHSTCTSVYAG